MSSPSSLNTAQLGLSAGAVQPGELTPYPKTVNKPSLFQRTYSDEGTSNKTTTEFQKMLGGKIESQPNLLPFENVNVLVVEDMNIILLERHLKQYGFLFEGKHPVVITKPQDRQESLEDLDLDDLTIEEREPQIFRAKTADDAIWAVLESKKIFHFVFMDNQLIGPKRGFDAAQKITTVLEETNKPVPTMFSISSTNPCEEKYKPLFKAELGKAPNSANLHEILLKCWPEKT